MDRKGIPLGPRDDAYALLASDVDGRAGVLRTDDGTWSTGVALINAGEDAYLHLRIRVRRLAYVHLVLRGRGAIVTLVTGATDADAAARLQGELLRRGVTLD